MTDQKPAKKVLSAIAVILSVCIVFLIGRGSLLFTKRFLTLPKVVYINPEKSPDGKVEAMVLRGSNGTIYGNEYFLSVRLGRAKMIIDRDLAEGFGDYEGGIHEIEWLDNKRIAVFRTIADQPDTVIFDIRSGNWDHEDALKIRKEE